MVYYETNGGGAVFSVGSINWNNSLVWNDYQNDMAFPMALNNAALHQHALNQQAAETAQSSLAGSSPTGTLYEVQSLSDNEWSMINYQPNRNSSDSFGTVDNPSEKLHIRTNSDSSCSDEPHSAELSGSYEEIAPWPLHSPHDFSMEPGRHDILQLDLIQFVKRCVVFT